VGGAPVVLGSEGGAVVVSYYAGGIVHTVPMEAQDAAILAAVEEVRPDVLVLGVTHRMGGIAATRYGPLIRQMEARGFREVDRAQLPPGCESRALLIRSGSDRDAAAHRPVSTSPGSVQ
jgi:hypothetical protein